MLALRKALFMCTDIADTTGTDFFFNCREEQSTRAIFLALLSSDFTASSSFRIWVRGVPALHISAYTVQN